MIRKARTSRSVSPFRWIFLALFALSAQPTLSQPANINFQKLGFSEGLHDGIIRCIAQDRFGYIWIGTVGAINRYNGRKVTVFTNVQGDSTTPYATQPRCMYSDPEGRFWIGSETGLMEYDFLSGRFWRVPDFRNRFIVTISSLNDSSLLVVTRRGSFLFNKKSKTVISLSASPQREHAVLKGRQINRVCRSGNLLFLATSRGLVTLNTQSAEAKLLSFPALDGIPLHCVDADGEGNIWISSQSGNKFFRLNARLDSLALLDPYLPPGTDGGKPLILDVLVAKDKSIWLTTAGDGLIRYQPATQGSRLYRYNVHVASSPGSNDYRYIFQDQAGIIWLGCHNQGISYFDPGQNLFSTLLPFPGEIQEKYSKTGRAVTVDRQGNIWMGNHDGLSALNPATGEYRVWRNNGSPNKVLYSNTIRSIYCDALNRIWIGTSDGVNRFDIASQRMEFISPEYLPLSFYNSINGDKSGNIWFCTNDSAGLYWYDLSKKTYSNISHHPQLKKYAGYSTVSYLLEDSKERLWISFSRKGATMLDKRTGRTRDFLANDSAAGGLIGNLVIDIKEDKRGMIWLSTFNGVSVIDPMTGLISSYNSLNGLAGNMTAPLVIDSLDRVWIGASGGLTMISPNRKQFSKFDLSDGLSSVGFLEHAGISTPNGEIIMPTYTGYIRFNPAEYKALKRNFPFYVSGCTVSDRDYYRVQESDSSAALRLGPAENSFIFHMDALNYSNPSQTWFAYRLDGFEKDWHYTQDPKAVYTNIPGGHYRFRYKASVNNDYWEEVHEKVLEVRLGTYFYKTRIFYILSALAVLLLMFLFYRYRLRHKERLLILENKAQALEKEKAMVMYENLKQQLNPHFLFNSLTSLNSLIGSDPVSAATFLDSLSKTYRYILKSRDNETVLMEDEIRFAENYIRLQQTRFENGFEVYFDIPTEYNHRRIVPVTIQNLLENAIKHNIIDAESPLIVRIFVEDDSLVVRNNLQRKRMVETSNRQGLANLQSLYQYLSSRPVEITETETTFTVKLPLL